MNKKTIKEHFLDQIMVMIGIFIAILALIYSYAEPDIRFSSVNFKSTQIDHKNINNNEVYLYSVSPRFKNLSIKQGHISKVEIVPTSLDALYDVKILAIRSVSLERNRDEPVEIQFLVTISAEAGKKIRESNTNPTVMLFAYDNNGLIIEKNTVQGIPPFTRMLFTLNVKK